MIWPDHSREIPAGTHAFLSPSNYSWLNYGPDKLKTVYKNRQAIILGTLLHEQAKRDIELGLRRPKTGTTFNMYVNDGIGFRMTPEQGLYFSRDCFGTADTICFDERKGFLRIHDLKTGVNPASLKQLEIYAALFCLEHGPRLGFTPNDIEMELRIYQNDDKLIGHPTANDIIPIIDYIVMACDILEEMRRTEM